MRSFVLACLLTGVILIHVEAVAQQSLQAQAPAGPPSLTQLAQPRAPFGLPERLGGGQLLFDIGVAGDFVGNLTSREAEKTQSGTFSGRENRFFPREVELNLFGRIDPYASAEVRIEAGEEERGEETSVSLSEATITLLTLPYGTQLKLGKMRNRFGLTNVTHEHDLPFIDRPNVLVRFLGEEGLIEKGAELTWLPPLPFYLEVLAGLFNGDNETAFGRGSLRAPLVTGRVRTFFEPSDTSAIQFGLSAANGETLEGRRSTLAGFDVKYKYRPDGWLHPLLTLASEGIYSTRRTTVEQESEVDTDGDGVPDATIALDEHRTTRRFGWYVYGELQPWRRWAFGARYDNTQFPEASGREWAIGPYVAFMPSEFLRFRLGYKHTDRSGVEIGPRTVNEILLQASFILGAHPAHPF